MFEIVNSFLLIKDNKNMGKSKRNWSYSPPDISNEEMDKRGEIILEYFNLDFFGNPNSRKTKKEIFLDIRRIVEKGIK